MAGSLTTYAFINAKLKTRISKLLTDDFLRSLIHTQSLHESITRLSESSYGHLSKIYDETGDLKMCELALYRTEIALYSEVESHMKGGVLSFIQALATRYEIENLKNVLRIWFDRSVRRRDVATEALYLCRDQVHYRIDYEAILVSESLENIALILGTTPYADTVKSQATAVITKGSLFPLEIALDRHYFVNLFRTLESIGRRDGEVARRLIGAEVDLQNISRLTRTLHYYDLDPDSIEELIIPYGLNFEAESLRQDFKEGRPPEAPSELLGEVITRRYPALKALLSGGGQELASQLGLVEELLEEIVMHEVRRALGGYPFTIGIVLSYFLLKQREMRRLVSILNAKRYNLREERAMRLL